MPVSITLETPEVVREARNLPDVLVGGPIAEGAHEWFARDVFPKMKARDYGFRDRTGRLRGSLEVHGATRRSEIDLEVRSTVDYSDFVEYGHGGRFSFMRRAVRESERDLELRMDSEFDRFNRTPPNRYRGRRVSARG